MKYLLVLSICVLSLSCASKYELQPQAPEGLGSVYYQKTVGGRENSPVKYNFYVSVTNQQLVPQEIFFRNQKQPLLANDKGVYQAIFLISEKSTDFQMSADVSQEYNNHIQFKKGEFPFNLAEDEAVISYAQGKKKKFFKIEKLKEKPAIYLPGQPQRIP